MDQQQGDAARIPEVRADEVAEAEIALEEFDEQAPGFLRQIRNEHDRVTPHHLEPLFCE